MPRFAFPFFVSLNHRQGSVNMLCFLFWLLFKFQNEAKNEKSLRMLLLLTFCFKCMLHRHPYTHAYNIYIYIYIYIYNFKYLLVSDILKRLYVDPVPAVIEFEWFGISLNILCHDNPVAVTEVFKIGNKTSGFLTINISYVI